MGAERAAGADADHYRVHLLLHLRPVGVTGPVAVLGPVVARRQPLDHTAKHRRGQLATGRAQLADAVKAFFTEQGFQLASDALQVFGGYGYVTEFAIEQTLRDSRIAAVIRPTCE